MTTWRFGVWCGCLRRLPRREVLIYWSFDVSARLLAGLLASSVSVADALLAWGFDARKWGGGGD